MQEKIKKPIGRPKKQKELKPQENEIPARVLTNDERILQELINIKNILDNMWRERRP